MQDDKDRFKIYVEQLRDGHTASIDETLSCDFLAITEEALQFRSSVNVKGQVYLAGEELVFHLQLHALSTVPCIICNAPVEVPIDIANFYEAIALDAIPHGVFDMQEMLREAILLDTKAFAECQQGQCPQRAELARYLKKTTTQVPAAEPPSPFNALDSSDFENL